MKKRVATLSLICVLIFFVTYCILSYANWGKITFATINFEKPETIEREQLFGKAKDLLINGNNVTSQSEDSRLEFLVDKPQQYISIDIESIENETFQDRDCAQIFWANEGEAFGYEQSIDYTLHIGKNVIKIPTLEYQKIRIDLTKYKNVSFTISSVALCSKDYPDYLIAFWIEYIVLVWTIFSLWIIIAHTGQFQIHKLGTIVKHFIIARKRKFLPWFIMSLVVLGALYTILSFHNWGKFVWVIGLESPTQIEGQELFDKTKDLFVEANRITSLSEDSRLELNITDPKKFITIEVGHIDGLGGRKDKAQIFWGIEGEPFTYEKSKKFTLTVGRNIIEIPSDNYEKLRLDLTRLEGVSIDITGIELSDTFRPRNLSDFWLQYIVAVLFILLCVLFVKKRARYKEVFLTLRDQYKSFFISNVSVIQGSILLCLCIFGYEIFNFTLGGDEERELALAALGGNVYGLDVDVNIQNFFLVIGRYGNWLYRKIFMYKGIFTPVYTMATAVIFLLLTVWTWCIIFDQLFSEKIKKMFKIVFCGLFLSVPYASTAFLGYSIFNSSSSFAMLCSSIALLSIVMNHEHNKSNLAVASVLVSMGISIYQCHVNDFILGSCICILIQFIESPETSVSKLLKKVGEYVSAFVCGLIIYLFCDRIIVSSLIRKSSYTDAFITWGKEPTLMTISNLLHDIGDIFLSKSVPGHLYMLISIVLYLLLLCCVTIRQKDIVKKIIILSVGIFTVFSAFSVSLVLGTVLHWGTHMAVMLLVGFMWIFTIYYSSKWRHKKFLYYITVITMCLSLMRQIDIVNRIYFGGHVVSELDMELGYSIGTEVIKELGAENAKLPLYIVGKYRHPTTVLFESGMEGRSIFLRSHVYKVYLLNYLGFPFKVGNEYDLMKATNTAQDMPLWPMDGSILKTDNYIVVHLSDSY